MSLRQRKRRQNRADLKNAPATRTVTPVLGRTVRGLRLFDLVQRPAMPRTTTVIEQPFNPFYLGFNRDLKHYEDVKSYEQKFQKKEPVKKPLTSLSLDGRIITDLPKNHPICVARRERRELMFATRKAGKVGQRVRRKSVQILRCS